MFFCEERLDCAEVVRTRISWRNLCGAGSLYWENLCVPWHENIFVTVAQIWIWILTPHSASWPDTLTQTAVKLKMKTLIRLDVPNLILESGIWSLAELGEGILICSVSLSHSQYRSDIKRDRGNVAIWVIIRTETARLLEAFRVRLMLLDVNPNLTNLTKYYWLFLLIIIVNVERPQ